MNDISVEIILKANSTATVKSVLTACKDFLSQTKVKTSTIISVFDIQDTILVENVQHLIIDISTTQNGYYLDSNKVDFYVYTLNTLGPQIETCEDDAGGQVNLATHWVLPSAEMFNLWENLIYEESIKTNLLDYANSMMIFSDKGIDSNIISYNRVILLHGPPGTGKTSLCRALAHKLSIRMQNRFKNSILLEINSHSLFSKWFSESGKLVTKMFSNINDIISDTNTLVCVLIDEIESLAHAREQCMSGNEPSDSIKVVNAMLTQIDHIKSHPNVLILTTSNITGAIDVAFVDRADIKQYLGPPGPTAIYQIYYSCIKELIKAKIIVHEESECLITTTERKPCIDVDLMKLSEMSVGLSGRALRKIPLLAHSLFLKSKICNENEFLNAMSQAILYEKKQRSNFLNENPK